MKSPRLRLFSLLAVLVWAGSVSAQEASLITFPRERSFLPGSWLEAPIQAKFDPLPEILHEEVTRILEKAIAKYPDSTVSRYLGGVCVVGSLSFYDVNYGGTYLGHSRQIVLVYRDNFIATGFEQRFHHEFSSILLQEHQKDFDKMRWLAANDPAFTYRAGGVIERQEGDRSEATRVLAAEQEKTGGSGSSLLRLDPELMKYGFLTPYNQVSIEQDLNELAAHLFTNPKIWELCVRYPRIDQKIHVLINFYQRIDPRMDRLYFRRLTLEQPSPLEP